MLNPCLRVAMHETEAIAAGAETRVGHHMGGGRPQKAKRAAYKAIYVALVIATYVTAIVYMLSDKIVELMTPDPTLQRIVLNAFPIVGVGQIGLAASTICWDIMGAQGRIRLATFVSLTGSWLITLPFSAITVIVIGTNIQGPTAGVVIGYTISGAVLIGLVVMTDWEKWSKFVIEQNGEDSDSEFDDSSASSSSSDGGKYESYDWYQLPRDAKKACKVLGYTQNIWDNDGKSPFEDTEWDDLTDEQQRSAEVLGYTKASWNGNDEDPVTKTVSPVQTKLLLRASGSSSSSSASSEGVGARKYEKYDWEELPKEALVAAKVLGYTQFTWDNDLESPLDSKEWEKLTKKQQAAARTLGYNQTTWDNDAGEVGQGSPEPTSQNAPKLRPTSSSVSSSSTGSGGAYSDLDWDELPKKARAAAQTLGYSQSSWDQNLYDPDKDWEELSTKERKAAQVLGYTEAKWDGTPSNSAIPTPANESPPPEPDASSESSASSGGLYNDHDWDDLPNEALLAANILGYTKDIWQNDLDGPLEDTAWDELSDKQKLAASVLGYNEVSWG